MGRAPLSPQALVHAAEIARYSDLELERGSGKRGSRLGATGEKLRLLSGAAGALAVNNNAAALMLAVATMAAGREVVVSRGELVEIGGSFRLPDIIEAAGARLVEVGTTNRTHPEDYRRAIGAETALLLKVHRSNFEQRGFVRELRLRELVELGNECGVPVLEDIGSGFLEDLRPAGWPEESFVPGRLAQGAQVVCFSGDKLLGGPQAGILLGDADWIERMRRHPLARAFRLDKIAIALLDWTLQAMLEGEGERIPTQTMLRETGTAVRARAETLAAALRSALEGGAHARAWELAVVDDEVPVGAGSLPDFRLPSSAVTLRPTEAGGSKGTDQSIAALAARLREGDPSVVARIKDDALCFDARTLDESEIPRLVKALDTALARDGGSPRSAKVP